MEKVEEVLEEKAIVKVAEKVEYKAIMTVEDSIYVKHPKLYENYHSK